MGERNITSQIQKGCRRSAFSVNHILYLKMPNQEASSFFTKMIHASFVSLATVLLSLLQLHSGNRNASPFETHGPIMMLFVVTIFIYALVAMAAMKVQTLANHPSVVSVLNQLISISLGFLACDLLLLVLAPPASHWLLFLGCMDISPASVIALLRVYPDIRQALQLC